MTHEQRTAAIRWIMAVILAALTVQHWPQLAGLSPFDWAGIISLALLVALAQNLGIRVSYGQITLLPVVVLTAFLTLGLEPSLAVVVVGLILGGLWRLWRTVASDAASQTAWWSVIGHELWPLGRHGLSLLAANWALQTLGGTTPLTAIDSIETLRALLEGLLIYLIVHDVLLALDLWLRGLKVWEALSENRIPLLAMQLLPLALAPLAAIARWQLGWIVFFFFELILLTTTIVIYQLTVTQQSLESQVSRMRSFAAMSEALEASLELDPLLTKIQRQIAELLGVRNLQIVLFEEDGEDDDGPQIEHVFLVEGGEQIERDRKPKLDRLTNHVITTRLPLLADPVAQSTDVTGAGDLPPVRAWMGVPLTASNRLLGVMTTWMTASDQPSRSFSAADLTTFSAAGAQAGIMLENALLYRSSRQHAVQLGRLNEISTVMNASLNPERVLELIAESIADVAGCDKTAIYLLETDNLKDPSLLLAHARGFTPAQIARARDVALPLSEEEQERVMSGGEILYVSDINDAEADVSAAAQILARREKFSAYAYLPLQAQNSPIGVLAVYYDKPHEFDETELELLETFANHAALAVANARVYQSIDVQLARRIEQVVKMTDISSRLSSTLDMETVFNLIIESAMEGCEADASVLVLSDESIVGDPDDSQLNMVAWRGFDPKRSNRMPHHVAAALAESVVLKRGEPMLVNRSDAPSDEPLSQLSVPIVVEEKVIGALALESDVLNAFNDEDLTFVNQLAMQASVAIRNAQLFRRAEIVRDRLNAILDASNEGLLYLDTRGRIAMTNARMSDFWDFARGDFPMSAADETDPDPLNRLGVGLGYQSGELQKLLRQSARTPNMRYQTDLYVSRGGSGQRQRFVERTVAPVYENTGDFLGLLLILRDVTEQKELEQAREDLTSMIVHDLRSPLQAVMGSMRLIGELVKDDNPVITQATGVSSRAVKKLLNLVNNLLDLSRMEQDELVLDIAPESFTPVLEDAVQELMPLAQEIGTVIKLEVPDDLPDIKIDRDMISRVTINLIDNALKYSPPGMLVTVKAEQGKSDSGQDQMVVKVIDSGPGVPDEFKETVFERYTQVPGQKGRRPSAGLGLAFCKLAIEAHQGRIWVENNPAGKGSIFIFTLPLTDRIAAPPKASKPADESASTPSLPSGKDKDKDNDADAAKKE